MKIKKVVDICRREGVVRVYEDKNNVQWISNGYAYYPLYDIPNLSEDEFFTIFDFTDKQRNETIFERTQFPSFINSDDI